MDRDRARATALTLALALSALACRDIGDEVRAPSDDAGVDAADAASESVLDANVAPDRAVEASALRDAPADAAKGNVALVLADYDVSCAACAAQSCANYISACDQLSGVAAAGPGLGVARTVLCSETVACLLATGCADAVANTDMAFCYCGPYPTGLYSDCVLYPETNTGACKDAFERSMETTNPLTVVSSFGSVTRAGGWSALLFQCLVDNQCRGCFKTVRDAGAGGGSDR
ncbi:MAG TPA: hypothetical protein VJT73_20985 [Polyangiaceae bacterium]|nr:hypothetical protein [Polyangiaceae bacterium]